MNKPRQNIIKEALSSFLGLIPKEISDLDISLQFRDKNLKFNIITKGVVENAHVPFIIEEAKQLKEISGIPVLVIGKIIYPGVGKRLQEAHINFIDTLGNVFIEEDAVFIYQTGKKYKKPVAENKNKLFQEAGVKLLFGLLHHPEFIRLTYREMALATGVSLGSISTIFKELEKAGYVIEVAKGEKKLIRQKELLERWSIAFHEVLKPKITLGNFRLTNKKLFSKYKTIDISQWDALWGGEPAGDIYTNYLSPGKFCLFVPGDNKKWMIDLRLAPTELDPEIEVLKYFWDWHHPLFQVTKPHNNAVPPLLVYADLITSGDSRNEETAKRIFNEYLRFE